MAQKLWEKNVQVNEEIDRFTVGRDREMDLYLAKHDVIGSMAHITMLESIGLLTSDELAVLLEELKNIYASAEKGDFGAKFEKYSGCGEQDLLSFWRDCGVDGVFVGHCHKVNTSILWDGVRLTFGLKTGAYDYYSNGQLGGTLIECGNDGAFTVHHVPTLVPYDVPFLL